MNNPTIRWNISSILLEFARQWNGIYHLFVSRIKQSISGNVKNLILKTLNQVKI
jgi:hypothetical protein